MRQYFLSMMELIVEALETTEEAVAMRLVT